MCSGPLAARGTTKTSDGDARPLFHGWADAEVDAIVSDELSLWTVYDHPKDYPDNVVARRFVYSKRTEDLIIFSSLEEARLYFQNCHLFCLTRSPSDDPVIVETWL